VLLEHYPSRQRALLRAASKQEIDAVIEGPRGPIRPSALFSRPPPLAAAVFQFSAYFNDSATHRWRSRIKSRPLPLVRTLNRAPNRDNLHAATHQIIHSNVRLFFMLYSDIFAAFPHKILHTKLAI
jgi:hypothetical protein